MGESTVDDSETEAGWRRRFSGTEPRLSEVVEMYEQLGYEVRVEAVETREVDTDACSGCALTRSEGQHVVYTRKE